MATPAKRKYSDVQEYEFKATSTLNKISAHFTWNIQEFESRLAMLKKDGHSVFLSPVITVPVEVVSQDLSEKEGLAFRMKLHYKDSGVWVYLLSLEDIDLQVFFEIFIYQTDNTVRSFYSDPIPTFLGKKKEQGFGWEMLTLDEFEQDKDHFLDGTSVSIICKFAILSEKFRSKVIKTKKHEVSSLSDDLMALQHGGSFSDVKLECEARTLCCHKNVLSARSPVFAAMFTHSDTVEGRTDVVKIEDIKLETLKQVVEFIYSDKTTGLQHNAYNLFCAAEKYDIKSLKTQCEENLLQSLSVEKAADYLVLSYLYNSELLKKAASRYIANRMDEVMKTKGWTNIAEIHPKIMQEILQAMITKEQEN